MSTKETRVRKLNQESLYDSKRRVEIKRERVNSCVGMVEKENVAASPTKRRQEERRKSSSSSRLIDEVGKGKENKVFYLFSNAGCPGRTREG